MPAFLQLLFLHRDILIDIYKDENSIEKAFVEFSELVSNPDHLLFKLGLPLKGKTVEVSSIERADYEAQNVRIENGSYLFDLKTPNELVKDIQRALLQSDVNVKMVLDLTSKIKERAKKETELELIIQDQGTGLPFDPKPNQLTPGPSTKSFGTGLGIPIAFKICQKHGWNLKFYSPEENGRQEGTTVTITAPIRVIEEND